MYEKGCPNNPKQVKLQLITIAIEAMLQSLANADVTSQGWMEKHPGKSLPKHTSSLKDFLAGSLSAELR